MCTLLFDYWQNITSNVTHFNPGLKCLDFYSFFSLVLSFSLYVCVCSVVYPFSVFMRWISVKVSLIFDHCNIFCDTAKMCVCVQCCDDGNIDDGKMNTNTNRNVSHISPYETFYSQAINIMFMFCFNQGRAKKWTAEMKKNTVWLNPKAAPKIPMGSYSF